MGQISCLSRAQIPELAPRTKVEVSCNKKTQNCFRVLSLGLFKGFAMPPTPFFGSWASFQDPGPLPMASVRRAKGIRLIESFWRAIGAEIEPFS